MVKDSTGLVKLFPVPEEDRASLTEELTYIIDSDRLENLGNHLLTLEDDVFLVKDSSISKIHGCVLIRNYDRISGGREIVPWLRENPYEAIQYVSLLQETLKILKKEIDASQAVLKIEENDVNLIQSAEALGFTKEGIFISNRFLKGEFSFYSVYTYKLNEIKNRQI